MSLMRLRCVIERLTDSSASQTADSTTAEVDRVAAVPASLPFYDLPHFVLVTFGYSTADSLASRRMCSLLYSILSRRILCKFRPKID